MVRSKTSELLIQVIRPLGGPPCVLIPAAEFAALFALARDAATQSGAVEKALADKNVVRLAANSANSSRVAAQLQSLLGDSDAIEAIFERFTESRGRAIEGEHVLEPVFAPEDSQEAAEEAADLAAYEEARAREDEAFPLEVAERLVAGAHPIKVFREFRGMTQAELARQVGLSPVYVSQIETGRRGGSTKVLRRVAAALDIDLADLVQ
jgi:DNA-binding XRE family transcriptional regulator